MGIRVYPIWDNPTSKQALKTKLWQLPYFVDMSKLDNQSMDKRIR
ncbi:MepB family protein [Carnobacterium sp. TMP28]